MTSLNLMKIGGGGGGGGRYRNTPESVEHERSIIGTRGDVRKTRVFLPSRMLHNFGRVYITVYKHKQSFYKAFINWN